MKISVAKAAFILVAAAYGSGPAHAAPYPLGTLSCRDMGEFASQAMQWRESGTTREEAFAKLDERSYGDPVERKNLEQVLKMVFGRYGNAWTVESAGNAIRSDCETGR